MYKVLCDPAPLFLYDLIHPFTSLRLASPATLALLLFFAIWTCFYLQAFAMVVSSLSSSLLPSDSCSANPFPSFKLCSKSPDQ